MSHPNNNTQNETNYPSSDEYYSSDDNFELNGDSEAGTGAWRFLKMPTEANLCLRLNDADTFLLNTFIEEINVICNRVLTKIDTTENIMMQVAGLFLDPVMSGWVDAANAGTTPDDALLTDVDMYHFIQTLAYLSFYGKTPTVFFNNEDAFPPASFLSHSLFTRVLRGFANRSSDEFSSIWEAPYRTCHNVICCEKQCNQINASLAYIDKISILSQDDDHYRLTSKTCEDIGLQRINNPKKAFGPVATGSVSLTSGITLSIHVANRGETALDVTQILMMSLTNKVLPHQAKGSNIIAMDRGYWNRDLIEYLSCNGFQLIGTHKRTKQFPFTFGNCSPTSCQREISEIGAKSIYWESKKVGSTCIYAGAYRDGKGNVATLFTTIKDMSLYSFRYIPKRGNCIIVLSIVLEMNRRVKQLTTGQGGVDWHFIRATSGAITSTTASIILRRCQDDIPDTCLDLLPLLGIGRTTRPSGDTYGPVELNSKTVQELKEILRQMNLPTTGTKSVLVGRIIGITPQQRDIKQDLMKIWFMKPLKKIQISL